MAGGAPCACFACCRARWTLWTSDGGHILCTGDLQLTCTHTEGFSDQPPHPVQSRSKRLRGGSRAGSRAGSSANRSWAETPVWAPLGNLGATVLRGPAKRTHSTRTYSLDSGALCTQTSVSASLVAALPSCVRPHPGHPLQNRSPCSAALSQLYTATPSEFGPLSGSGGGGNQSAPFAPATQPRPPWGFTTPAPVAPVAEGPHPRFRAPWGGLGVVWQRWSLRFRAMTATERPTARRPSWTCRQASWRRFSPPWTPIPCWLPRWCVCVGSLTCACMRACVWRCCCCCGGTAEVPGL